jgi:glycogen debranching enzyme
MTASAFPIDDMTPSERRSGDVTLVAGSSFVISDGAGDMKPGGSHGYYAGDTRVVSRLAIRVSESVPRLLDHHADEHRIRSCSAVGDPTNPELLVERCTEVADTLAIRLDIHNLTSLDVSSSVDVVVGADFADLFDVKRGVAPRAGFVGSGPLDDALVLTYQSGDFRRTLSVRCSVECEFLRDGIRVEVPLGPRETRSMTFEFVPQSTPGTPLHLVTSGPVEAESWSRNLPELRSTSASIQATWDRSCSDIGSLLLEGSDGTPIIAAGSPWFMALFGRDSLITSCSTAMLGTTLGRGTLHALARRQGTQYGAESAEEPGRILHELRAGEVVLRPGGWGAVYYGSVDATPLFVSAIAAMWRWGAPADEIEALLPAAERAVAWMLGDGDRDGDGLVEYGGQTTAGVASLANQGWKDSDDAVRHRDGSLAVGPIAMVEVQGYCHSALHALADLREAFGTGDPSPLRARAAALADQIDAQFWMDDEDCYALALDGRKRQVGSVASNAGHLLWTGTARPERAERLSARLLGDDMFTGFGLRTLSATNPGYNPLSYHCGSVWPHDTAIVAAGMISAGQSTAGTRLAIASLDAALHFGGRPPELFGGFSRAQFGEPVPYPSSCSPQAWAAGSAIMLVQAMLGISPDVPRGSIDVRPCLPDDVRVEVSGVPLGRGRLDVGVHGATVEHAGVSGPLRIDVVTPHSDG